MSAQQLNSTSASQNQFGWIIGVGFGAVAFGGIALALAPIAVPAIGIGATAIGLGALSSTAIGAGLVVTSATIGAIAGVFAEPVLLESFLKIVLEVMALIAVQRILPLELPISL
jgi:hypothetical protein